MFTTFGEAAGWPSAVLSKSSAAPLTASHTSVAGAEMRSAASKPRSCLISVITVARDLAEPRSAVYKATFLGPSVPSVVNSSVLPGPKKISGQYI
jgi:hypothetical protein